MIHNKLVKAALSTIYDEVQLIGTPDRQNVKSIEDFINKASGLHQTQPIFANVHETIRSGNIYEPTRTNKLFFDFDVPKNFEGTYAQGRQMIENDVETTKQRLINRGVSKKDILRGWTAKKGDHIYVKFKEIKYDNQEEWAELRRQIKGFQLKMIEGCPSADRKVLADFSRISRVFGIERPDSKLTPIPVGLDTTVNEWLVEHNGWAGLFEAGEDILWNWGNGVKSFSNYVREDDYKYLRAYNGQIRTEIIDSGHDRLDAYGSKDYHIYLTDIFNNIMPHGFVQKLLDIDADYNTRIAGASYFWEAGFDEILTTNLLALIGWHNFDYDTTFDHVQTLYRWNNNRIK